MNALLPNTLGRWTPHEVLQLFVEFESLRYRDKPDAKYPEIARQAMDDLCAHVGVHPRSQTFQQALHRLLKPCLFSDVPDAVRRLSERGYKLLGISLLDQATFAQHFEYYVPAQITVIKAPTSTASALFLRDYSIARVLKGAAESICPGLQPSELLVATSGISRVVEPLHEEGVPTVVIRRPGALEANIVVRVPKAVPSLCADSLLRLCDELEAPSGPPMFGQQDGYCFRIAGLYHVTSLLGVGGYGVRLSMPTFISLTRAIFKVKYGMLTTSTQVQNWPSKSNMLTRIRMSLMSSPTKLQCIEC